MKRTDFWTFARSLSDDDAIGDYFLESAFIDGEPFFKSTLSVSLSGERFFCGGVGRTVEEAIDKALMELVERATFLKVDFADKAFRPISPQGFEKWLPWPWRHAESLSSIGRFDYPLLGPTTVGCAAHFSAGAARSSAVLELTERHLFLVAQLRNIPGSLRGVGEIQIKGESSIKTETWAWRAEPNYYLCLTEAHRDDGRTTFGLGCATDIKQATRKSKCELLLQIRRLKLNDDKLTAPEKRFYTGVKSEAPTLLPVEVLQDQFFCATLKISSAIFFARAVNPFMQLLFPSALEGVVVHPLLRRESGEVGGMPLGLQA